MLFWQETHSTLKDEVSWSDEINAKLFFSYSISDLIAFLGTNKLTVKKKISNRDDRFLKLDIEIDGESFVFINQTIQTQNPNKLELLKNSFRIQSY